jgi:hypothetical protein
MIDSPQTAREQHIQALIVDANVARQELVDVLERGDVFRTRACLIATNRRAASDIRLGWWFLRNGVCGVWRFLRVAWIIGWRQGMRH